MIDKVQDLFSRIKEAPPHWFSQKAPSKNSKKSGSIVDENDGLDCTSYNELVLPWMDALHWSENIDIAFATMLSVVASTKLQGSQIWSRVMGPPGSVKTTLCEAVGANKRWCHNFSKFTGIHSGDAKVPEGSRIIDKIQDRTCIVNEGDMIVSAPPTIQLTILSELRDIYSGIIRSEYRTGLTTDITGVRSTWIIAGTGSLRMLNRSQLGDRFFDVIIYKRNSKGGEDAEENLLLEKVANYAINRCRNESGEDLSQKDTNEKITAIRKTIGFVDWLRENTPSLTGNIADKLENNKSVSLRLTRLAQLVAYMRTRPDAKSEAEDIESELATRLTEQFIRLAICLTVVLGKDQVDSEVLRRVAKVAEDTCYGSTFTLAKLLYNEPLGKPLTIEMMFARTKYKLETVKHAKNILVALECIKGDNSRNSVVARGRTTGLWKLSSQMNTLMRNLKELTN